MLARSRRLSVGQFKVVMDKGRVTHSSLFLIKTLAVDGPARIAAVAPQRTFKRAVDRTSIRRLIYASLPNFFTIVSGRHVIVLAKGHVLEHDREYIGHELQSVFVKAGLIK